MKKVSRIFFLAALLTGQIYASFAVGDKGKKRGNKVILNIKTPNTFSSNLNFNLRNGMRFTGSLANTPTVAGAQNTLITYRKGNSVYIVPYKQKVLVADVRQGYTGTKLIIKVP